MTNNSIAKYSSQFYSSEIEGLMWSQEQFVEYLRNLTGTDVFNEKILPKLKEIVVYSLKCCVDQMKPRKRSLELFGYDFMVDSNMNTWLIEINSSPAMDHSTWLTSTLVWGLCVYVLGAASAGGLREDHQLDPVEEEQEEGRELQSDLQ